MAIIARSRTFMGRRSIHTIRCNTNKASARQVPSRDPRDSEDCWSLHFAPTLLQALMELDEDSSADESPDAYSASPSEYSVDTDGTGDEAFDIAYFSTNANEFEDESADSELLLKSIGEIIQPKSSRSGKHSRTCNNHFREDFESTEIDSTLSQIPAFEALPSVPAESTSLEDAFASIDFSSSATTSIEEERRQKLREAAELARRESTPAAKTLKAARLAIKAKRESKEDIHICVPGAPVPLDFRVDLARLQRDAEAQIKRPPGPSTLRKTWSPESMKRSNRGCYRIKPDKRTDRKVERVKSEPSMLPIVLEFETDRAYKKRREAEERKTTAMSVHEREAYKKQKTLEKLRMAFKPGAVFYGDELIS